MDPLSKKTCLQELSAHLVQVVLDEIAYGDGTDVGYEIDARGEWITIGRWRLDPPAACLLLRGALNGDANDDPEEWLASFCEANGQRRQGA